MSVNLYRILPGLLFTGILAATGIGLSQLDWACHLGLSGLTLAIVLGILFGNSVYHRFEPTLAPGILIAKGPLLRAGIILYGLKITFQQIASVGLSAIAIDVLVLSSTLCLAYWVGTRVLKLDHDTTLLIGAGSSICGAAAVMATEPVLKAPAEKVSIAVATVVVFGTLSMFLYPVLFHVLSSDIFIFGSQQHYGVFAGSTIHEVAQVYAAGQVVGAQAADTAVIVKMIRVMMLAPVLLILSVLLNRIATNQAVPVGTVSAEPSLRRSRKITIPWFAVLFIVMAGIHSLGWVPVALGQPLIQLDTVMLSMAMAGLGLTTQISAIRAAGVKPLLLGSLLFAYLIIGGGLINGLVDHLAF